MLYGRGMTSSRFHPNFTVGLLFNRYNELAKKCFEIYKILLIVVASSRVIRNREQHLLGLFRVTLKAIEISSSNALLNDISSLGEHGDDGERRFLELNDIHK